MAATGVRVCLLACYYEGATSPSPRPHASLRRIDLARLGLDAFPGPGVRYAEFLEFSQTVEVRQVASNSLRPGVPLPLCPKQDESDGERKQPAELGTPDRTADPSVTQHGAEFSGDADERLPIELGAEGR